MNSQSHAVAMDQVYQYQRFLYDLTRKYYLFGRDTLLQGLNVPDGARVLEVGCGTGRNLIQVAQANPQALFYGFDISRAMLDTAETKASRSVAGDRTFLTVGDAETFNACKYFGLDGFDRIFLSYTLSMIPDWESALDNATDQLKENGSIHIVDFGTMYRWPAFLRRTMRAWLARFKVTPRDSLLAAVRRLARRRGYRVRIEQLGGGYAVLAEISRHPVNAPEMTGAAAARRGVGKHEQMAQS